MKRRNFLSGLLAAPLAWKARLVQLFGQSPVNPCAAPRLMLTDRQRQVIQLLAEGKSMKEAVSTLWPRGLQQWAEKPGVRGTFKRRRISLN